MNGEVSGDIAVFNRYLGRAVAEFASSRLAIPFMRRLLAEFPNEFVQAGMQCLDSGDESPAHRFLTTMLLRQSAIFDDLANPSRRTTKRAVRLFRRFLSVDPSFDVQLARCLPDRTGTNHSVAFDRIRISRALDVLDETSRGRRLLPVLGHLPNSRDPRISARAVLFIGRRVQSAAWAEKQLRREDPRARANAVESLWGLHSPDTTSLLELCAADRSNRVAGNALVGLGVAGEPDAHDEILRMAHRPQDPFRSTAAWCMGKLGNTSFLDPLRQLARDDSPQVRGAALRALIGIRRTEAAVSGAQMLAGRTAEEQTTAIETAAPVLLPQPAAPKLDLRLDGTSFAWKRER